MPGNNGRSGIIVAIIGATALIIGAVIGSPIIAQQMAIQATQTKESRLTEIALEAASNTESTKTAEPSGGLPPTSTHLPEPTATPQSTYTPYPTFTVPPEPTQVEQPTVQSQPTDTPPGTVLQVGETWISDGLYVQLKDIDFAYGDQAFINFTFTNQRDRAINLYINHDVHVTMTDDKGNLYTWDSLYEENASIEPGLTWYDRVYKGGNLSRASYFIIELDIPGLITAQWKY